MFNKLKALTQRKSLDVMSGINSYGRQLSESEIQSQKHRDFIGGMWSEIGQLQFNFMLEQGLQPEHKILDIGCGCLRGGIHFIDYLNAGNYYGLDINASLIEAAQREVKQAQLEEKNPNLLVSEQFAINQFQQQFEFMLSVSLFSHLPMNIIIRCLSAVQKNLAAEGKYFSTFFIAPHSAHIAPINHHPSPIITNYDCDPFHYSIEEISFMAHVAGLEATLIGDWNHPRHQQMVSFTQK